MPFRKIITRIPYINAIPGITNCFALSVLSRFTLIAAIHRRIKEAVQSSSLII
jgi:hypothetical protein